MTSTRLYAVREKESNTLRLVEATNAAQALRHVAAQAFEVVAAKPKAVALHMAAGGRIEQAASEQIDLMGVSE